MNRADDFLRKYVFRSWIFLFLFLVSNAGNSSTGHVSRRSLYSEPSKPTPGPEKEYSGLRLKNDSILLVYYHEQTVAIVEADRNRAMYNCELLEVKTKADKMVALNGLKQFVPSQMKIGFNDMIDLMNECNKLNVPWDLRKEGCRDVGSPLREARQFISILSGMFPGTKWCGPGDHASSYHDLGLEREIDKCCRHHDLCPVKVSALRTQYNLTNYGFYTRSHCRCDEVFYDCLKLVDSTVSKTLGRIYFNVAPVICVEDAPNAEHDIHKMKKQFTAFHRRF